MAAKGVLAAMCGLLLSSCVGIYGPKGNDTGGVIPWSPENESMMMMLAQGYCGTYNRVAVITTVQRVYGDFITYECQFGPPRARSVGPSPAYTEGPSPARTEARTRPRNTPAIVSDEPVMMR